MASSATTDRPDGGGDAPVAARREPVPWWAVLLTHGLAATSIFALLADLYGIATMATFTRLVTVPGLGMLAVVAVAPVPGLEELRKRIRVGAVGGLVGTVGYDLFRVPFVLGGMRLLAPIDSYGLLIWGHSQASTLSGTIGWLFHVSNGVTFGVMYGVIAARRHWVWGVVWALVLETCTLVTPFRERYNLSGMYVATGIAYAAHVFYGWPLGRMVQRLDRADEEMRSVSRRAPALLLAVAGLSIVVWLRPWSVSPASAEARRLAEQLHQPVAVVTADRFTPEWLAVRHGGCIAVVNHTAAAFATTRGPVAANATSQLCFPRKGVERVKLSDGAYSGGFVFVR